MGAISCMERFCRHGRRSLQCPDSGSLPAALFPEQAEHRQERNGEYGISIVSAWTGGRGGEGETLW